MKGNSKKASIFYLVGTLFNKGIGFLTVPVFTRILSVEDYGLVTTYNSWVTIAMMFISLALYMAVRISFVDYQEKTEEVLSSILIFTLLYGISLSLIIYFVALRYISTFNYAMVAFCLLQALGSALIENISQFLMMKYRYKFRTLIMVLPNLTSTVLAIIIIRYILSSSLYLGRIVPSAVVTFIFGIVLALYFIYKGKFKFNKEYLLFSLKISVPLVLHGIALNILSQSDRTMITMIRGSRETGIYGLVYNFSMIATVITTAFEGIWVPYFVNKMNRKEYRDINAMAIKYIELMLVAMMGVILIGPEIIKILATKSYWKGITIIPPIVISNLLIFMYTLYVNVEHYYKKTVFISINTLIAAIINIILNIWFISWWGYIGAAYSTLISYCISLILHMAYSRRLNRRVIPIQNIILPLLILGCIVIVFYIFMNQWIIRWIVALLCLIILLLKERRYIKQTIMENKNV